MKRFLERFDLKKKPHVGARVCPSDFGDTSYINKKVPVLPDTSYLGRSIGNFDSMQFGTREGEQAF
jgi:hypothetical protein